MGLNSIAFNSNDKSRISKKWENNIEYENSILSKPPDNITK